MWQYADKYPIQFLVIVLFIIMCGFLVLRTIIRNLTALIGAKHFVAYHRVRTAVEARYAGVEPPADDSIDAYNAYVERYNKAIDKRQES